MEQNTNIASVVTDMLNNYGTMETNKFLQDMQREHRTLQQSFTKLCLLWLEQCASGEYRHDLRNEASHKISKAVIESWQETNADDKYLRGVKPSQMLPTI